MNKLDEIAERTDRGPLSIPWRKDVRLLMRAVRQLSEERRAFQSLFEAVDNIVPPPESEIYIDDDLKAAFDAVSNTPEPDDDVLELIKEAE